MKQILIIEVFSEKEENNSAEIAKHSDIQVASDSLLTSLYIKKIGHMLFFRYLWSWSMPKPLHWSHSKSKNTSPSRNFASELVLKGLITWILL